MADRPPAPSDGAVARGSRPRARDGGPGASRPVGRDLEQRLLVLMGDVVAGREPREREIDDAFAGLLRGAGLTVVASRQGLRHPSFAELERDLFVRTSRVERVSEWCVNVLEAAGVRCATLKGPALAVQLFGDDVTRPSSDVDVLVPRSELDAALGAFHAAGLRAEARHAAWYERTWHCHAVFDGAPPDRGLPLEIHWSIARPGLMHGRIDGLFDHLIDVECSGRRLPAPDLEWQLLVCAVHAAQHFFAPRPLLDLALVSRGLDESQWGAAADRACALGLGPAVYYATTVSAARLGWRAPAAVEALEGLRPEAWREAIAQRAIARLPVTGVLPRDKLRFVKTVTPVLTTAAPWFVVGLAYQLTDRPRVADAVWRRRLARRQAGIGP